MKNRIGIPCLLVLLFLIVTCPCAGQTPSWSLELQRDSVNDQVASGFQITGLLQKDLDAIREIGLDSAEGQRLLQLFVGDSPTPVFGKVTLDNRRLVFQARFALDLQLEHRLVFHGEHIREDHSEPLVKNLTAARVSGNTAPRLTGVWPSQSVLPQNVLRMYLYFSQPMAQGRAYDHIHFLDVNGSRIEKPYLEIEQELWSPDGKRLTLLFDPGRIKRGLARHEQLGPPFVAGHSYTLVVDRNWKSATGVPLEYATRHSFQVVEPDRIQPAVNRWQVGSPTSPHGPLTVNFAEPLDHGMLQHALSVTGDESNPVIEGEVEVLQGGSLWSFQPLEPWVAGDYSIDVNPDLEDRAGNSLARPFERTANAPALDRPLTRLSFNVGETESPPNVVFILADDLGWRDLGCQGSTFYESNNIDRIAKEGIRFTQGYAACQVCSPSRAAIMTGKSPARIKITDYIGAPSGTDWKRNTRLLPAYYQRHLPHEETTLAEAFGEAGYQTFFAGKWHLGNRGSYPQDHGFDVNVGGHQAGTPPGGFFTPYKNPQMSDGPPGECLPVRLGQETARFIEQHSDSPFFACLSFYSVHAPIQSTELLWSKYREKALQSGLAESRFLIDRTLPVRQVQDHPLYAGMIESMDDGVGLVLDKLDQLGLTENTIVVFTSDNGGVSSGDGYATSNLPLRGGKGRQWEGGIREPFFIRWPKNIAAGTSNATPVIGTDLYPTLLDLAGLAARPEQHLDGISLKPLLNGGELAERPLIWHYPHYGNQGGEPSSIIRWGKWKLVRYLEDGRIELYDLDQDAGEQNDVAPVHPDRVASMTARLDAWLDAVDAEFPVSNPQWDAEADEKRQRNMREKRLPDMERNHARFLDSGFRPRNGWWEQVLPDGKKQE